MLFDIGGTLVVENDPPSPVAALVPTLLANVVSDLTTLAGILRLGAATNTAVMTELDVRKLLAQVGIDHFFEVVVTSGDVGVAKPDPTLLLVAKDRLGINDASRILYVGDRPTDRQAALAAGAVRSERCGGIAQCGSALGESTVPRGSRSSSLTTTRSQFAHAGSAGTRVFLVGGSPRDGYGFSRDARYAARRSLVGVLLQSPQRMSPGSLS